MLKILFIFFFLLSSCSTQFTKPEVSLIDLDFIESTLFETNLKTQIRISNPNKKTLNINGSKHRLVINDIDVGTAMSNQNLSIPALGETTDTLTLRVSNLKLLYRLEKIINSQNFKYNIDSTFYTDRAFGLGTINSSTEGSL